MGTSGSTSWWCDNIVPPEVMCNCFFAPSANTTSTLLSRDSSSSSRRGRSGWVAPLSSNPPESFLTNLPSLITFIDVVDSRSWSSCCWRFRIISSRWGFWELTPFFNPGVAVEIGFKTLVASSNRPWTDVEVPPFSDASWLGCPSPFSPSGSLWWFRISSFSFLSSASRSQMIWLTTNKASSHIILRSCEYRCSRRNATSAP